MLQRLPSFPIVAITVTLSLMATAGCIRTSDTATKELEEYLVSSSPVLKRHGDTTEEVNNANLHFQQQIPKQVSVAQQTRLLDDYIAKLEWAVPRLRADLDEAQRLAPPSKAIPFHNKFVEALQYDFSGISEIRSFYVGVRASGVGDIGLLDHGNSQLLKARLAITVAMTLLRSLATD